MTKRQLAAAEARHAAGLPWHDGPPLFNAELDGHWIGIGTTEELDALKASNIIDAAATYRPVEPRDLAA